MTIPNAITLARLALIVPLAIALEGGYTLWALGLFAFASGTDWIDGYLARKLNQTSALGALLDPLVDKILVTTALAGLTYQGVIPAWSVTLVLSREFLITGLRAAAINAGIVLSASLWGKLKTVTQMAAILALLAAGTLLELTPFAQGLWWAAVLFTLGSGIEYLWQTRNIWKEPTA
jgi:CDP-diacylglycerol--glycerol-3-phosphate 3-phosphatidyltransferase